MQMKSNLKAMPRSAQRPGRQKKARWQGPGASGFLAAVTLYWALLGGSGTSIGHCWAVQAGLLTPSTFARHRLSPLASFTSGT